MRDREVELTRWVEALAAMGESAGPRGDCPEADLLLSAALGEAQAAAVEEVVDHIAGCAACREGWRLAVEVESLATGEAGESERSSAGAPASRKRRPHAGRRLGRWLQDLFGGQRPSLIPAPATVEAARGAGLALSRRRVLALATAGLLIGAVMVVRQATMTNGTRGSEAEVLSLLEDRAALPRERFLLRWSGPEGALYSVTLVTAELEPVFSIGDLEAEEIEVPASAFDSVPSEATLLWRVDAVRADGSQIRAEETWVVRID